MADLSTEQIEKIEEKVDRGEKLTPEEEALLDGNAPEVTDDEQVDPEKKTAGVKKEDASDKSKESKEKAAETPAEKDAEAAKAKEKEAADAAAKEAEERKKLIEAEAEKPLDEADIKDYSPTERALFFELRKERRKRQDAQRETDTLKFQREKERLRKEWEAEQAEKKAKEQPAPDPFEGMADDDIFTVGQAKKMFSGKKESSDDKSKKTDNQAENQRVQRLVMENWILKAQTKAPDVLDVIAFDSILENDPNAIAEVKDVVSKGGNAVLATYNLIKAHPKWPEIEAQIKAKKGAAGKSDDKTDEQKKKDEEAARENKERAERIEKNNNKTKTTGGGGSGSAASGEYTLQEISEMSEEDFAKLPKAQREKILEQLG